MAVRLNHGGRRQPISNHNADSITVGSPGNISRILYSNVRWAPRYLNRLFVQELIDATSKENTKAPHYWLFVRGIHRVENLPMSLYAPRVY